MKKLFFITVAFLINIASFAQLPDLIGEKASIKQLKSSYGQYEVEEGRLLDVRSYDEDDNIYINASIIGSNFEYDFSLTTDRNGIVTNIMYLYDNINETHFNFLKETVVKVHRAQFVRKENGISVYTATLFGIKRNLIFVRNPNGKAIVSFKL